MRVSYNLSAHRNCFPGIQHGFGCNYALFQRSCHGYNFKSRAWFKRINYPEQNRTSVFDRMRAERKQIATRYRSEGESEARKIRAEAEKQREVILAEAERDAQRDRGLGDAKAAEIYAKAYDKDAEVYSFYRSLDAYRESFKGREDVLLLGTDNEFFRYFKDSGGR